MNTQDNQNAQEMAKVMQEVVVPAIAKMLEDQQIEAVINLRAGTQSAVLSISASARLLYMEEED